MAYRDDVLAESPAGYWRFEETSGTNANDETANNLDGTISGATVNQTGALGGTGNAGKAYQFDGVNDYVQVADNNAIDFTTAFTLEAWIYYDDTVSNGYPRIFHKDGSYSFMLEKITGLLRLEVNGLSQSQQSSSAIPANTWTNVAVTYHSGAGNNCIYYINGVQDAAVQKGANAVNVNANPLRIGNRADGARPWKGLIDEPALFPVVLTAEEILAIYESGTNPPAGGGEQFIANLSGVSTNAGLVIWRADKRAAGTSTNSGRTSKAAAKNLSGSTSNSGVFTRVVTKVLQAAGGSHTVGQLARSVTKVLGGQSLNQGALRKDVSIRRTGASSNAGVISRQTTKVLTAVSAGTGQVSRAVTAHVSGASANTGNLIRSFLKIVTFTGSSTSSGELTNTITHVFLLLVSGASNSAGALQKVVTSTWLGVSDASVGRLSKIPSKSMLGSSGSAGTLGKAVTKFWAGLSTSIGTLTTTLPQADPRTLRDFFHKRGSVVATMKGSIVRTFRGIVTGPRGGSVDD